MNINSYELDISSRIQKLNYRDLIIFLIPFVIFLLYLYVYNPSILTTDSFSQLHQIATGKYTNWHPFFHTFIEMLCLKVYAHPASVAILQIVVFSLMWMTICKYHRDDDAEDNVFILQAIITLIICLIPINAIYSITLWKDILFSYFLMFLCFLIKVMLDKKGTVSHEFIILMALVMAFVSQLRPNGIYIIVISLIVFAIYLFKKDSSSKIHIALPALTIIFILLIASLNVAFDVSDDAKDAVFAKTSHMLADYDLNLNLEDSDRDKIHKLLDESKIKDSYTVYYSDPIYWIANKDVYDQNSWDYLSMAFKYSMKNPLHCLSYLFKSSAMVWDITRDSDWTGSPYYITGSGANVEHAKEKFFESINETPKESYEDVSDINTGTAKYDLLNSFVNKARTNLLLDTLFNSPALYMYLAIIIMAFIHILTKSKEIYLVYLPNLINILIIFASTPVQDNRYLYANLLICYLLVIILITLLQSSKEKPYEFLTKKHNKDVKKINNESINDIKIEDSTEIDALPYIPKNEEEMPPKREETQEEMEARIREKILKELEMERQNREK